MKFNISLYLVFVFVGEIITYEFKCPDALERTIRVKTVCVEKSSDRYSCLLDEHTYTYMESCIEPADFVRPEMGCTIQNHYQCRSALSGPSTCTYVKIDKPVVNLTKTGKEPINVQDLDYINKITEVSRIQTTIVIFVSAIMMFCVVAIIHNKHKIKEQLVCLEYNDLGSTTTTVNDTSTADKNIEKLTKYDNDKKIHETIASENLLTPSQREGKKKHDACLDRIQFYGRYTLYDTISDIDLT